MIVPNASIRGYSIKTGVDAQGASVFSDLVLPGNTFPGVRVDEPSSSRRTSPEAETQADERELQVSPAELAAIGVEEAKVGDLLTIKWSNTGSDQRLVINSLKPSGTPGLGGSIDVLRLSCSPG